MRSRSARIADDAQLHHASTGASIYGQKTRSASVSVHSNFRFRCYRTPEYGLEMGRDPASMRSRPGEVFGILTYGHPFLDGNGRSLMTVHTDLARRAGFHIAWQDIGKAEFLSSLTEELRKPGGQLDRLLAPHIVAGPLPLRDTAARLSANPDLNPTDRPSGPSPGF